MDYESLAWIAYKEQNLFFLDVTGSFYLFFRHWLFGGH
jgi:hypothetical protein